MKEFFKYVAAIIVGTLLAACIIFYEDFTATTPSAKAVSGKVITVEQIFNDCMKSEDCRVMAHASYYESRNQSDEGVVAVMHVIKNRVAHKAWPDTVKGVVYQKNQFSYLWDGSTKKAMKKEQHKRMAVLAHKVLNGEVESSVADSVFYHTRYIKKPLWARNNCVVTTIGSHVFYKGRSENGECK